MFLKDLLTFFEIKVNLPKYLYDESINEVFLEGNLSKENNTYKIVIETRKDVIHTLIINSDDDYPVAVSSLLPDGKVNGIKFGQSSGDLKYF